MDSAFFRQAQFMLVQYILLKFSLLFSAEFGVQDEREGGVFGGFYSHVAVGVEEDFFTTGEDPI